MDKIKEIIGNVLTKIKTFFEKILEKIKSVINKNENLKNKISDINVSVRKKLGIYKEKDDINVSVSKDSVGSDTFVKTNLSESDKEATKKAHDLIQEKKNKNKKLIKKILTIVILIVVVIIIIMNVLNANKKAKETEEVMKNVSTVRKMNIQSELSGSGTLVAKDSYNITSMVDGEVTGVFFEVGDSVEKDQLLLTIDSSTAQRNIITASASLAQAKDSFEKAKVEYERIESDYKDNTFKSPYTGYLRTFLVKAGDKIGNNTQIGTVIDESIMTIKLPFLSSDVRRLKTGLSATLTLNETDETIVGYVKSVATEKQTLDSGALVSYVTINCNNPGGLTTKNTATAVVSGIGSAGDASFEVETDKSIVFEDGNDVYIEKLLVDEGAYVEEGTPLFKITDKSIINVTQSKRNAYLSAQNQLIKAEADVDNAKDNYDEYNITSPIKGTVINKDAKVGDKIQNKSSSANTTLAVIYDLSELTFDMNVDELDISNVELGQKVNVQADAFNQEIFNGEITNINLVSNNSNGVTNYPVTVTIKDTKSLLPGMNVDGYVILKEAKDAIVIPADALQRGDVVYVLNSSKTIKEKTYNDENISDRVKNRAPEGFTAVNVKTGVSNDNFIQITEGLQEGDQVYVTTKSDNSSFRMMPMGGGPGGGPGGGGGPR